MFVGKRVFATLVSSGIECRLPWGGVPRESERGELVRAGHGDWVVLTPSLIPANGVVACVKLLELSATLAATDSHCWSDVRSLGSSTGCGR